jgi:hypothetical protein
VLPNTSRRCGRSPCSATENVRSIRGPSAFAVLFSKQGSRTYALPQWGPPRRHVHRTGDSYDPSPVSSVLRRLPRLSTVLVDLPARRGTSPSTACSIWPLACPPVRSTASSTLAIDMASGFTSSTSCETPGAGADCGHAAPLRFQNCGRVERVPFDPNISACHEHRSNIPASSSSGPASRRALGVSQSAWRLCPAQSLSPSAIASVLRVAGYASLDQRVASGYWMTQVTPEQKKMTMRRQIRTTAIIGLACFSRRGRLLPFRSRTYTAVHRAD